jgi:hypothetical protein
MKDYQISLDFKITNRRLQNHNVLKMKIIECLFLKMIKSKNEWKKGFFHRSSKLLYHLLQEIKGCFYQES